MTSEEATYSKITRRLVPFLFASYTLAYLDRVNVGFAKLQMQHDLHLSDAAYGTGAGVFFLGYFAFEVPSNVLLRRFGARRWIARIMVMWGALSTAMMFTNSTTTFYVLRFILGAAEAGFFPGVILYTTYWYPQARRARIVAMFMTATAVAGVFGGPVSGSIMKGMSNVWGLANWQWLYLLEGVPSLIMGVLALVILDDGPEKARWLTVEEKALVRTRLEEEERMKQAAGDLHGITLADAFRKLDVWLLSVAYFAIITGAYGVSFWLPQIIKDSLTTDPWRIGLLSMIPWGVTAVVMVANGRHSDRTGERCWHIALPAMIGSAAFWVSSMKGISGVTGLLALTVATAGVMSAASAFWTLPTRVLSGVAAAAGIALINSIGNLSGYVAPAAIGKIKDATGDIRPALSALSLSLFLGGVAVVLISRFRMRAIVDGNGALAQSDASR
jgi:D-galactonate transporter